MLKDMSWIKENELGDICSDKKNLNFVDICSDLKQIKTKRNERHLYNLGKFHPKAICIVLKRNMDFYPWNFI